MGSPRFPTKGAAIGLALTIGIVSGVLWFQRRTVWPRIESAVLGLFAPPVDSRWSRMTLGRYTEESKRIMQSQIAGRKPKADRITAIEAHRRRLAAALRYASEDASNRTTDEEFARARQAYREAEALLEGLEENSSEDEGASARALETTAGDRP